MPPVWMPVRAARISSRSTSTLVPPEYRLLLVHYAQDTIYHRPLVPGIELTTTARVHSVRSSRLGAKVCLRAEATDPQGAPVVNLFTTIFIRGLGSLESFGPDQPDRSIPRHRRADRLAEVVLPVDEDQSYRYPEASGDSLAAWPCASPGRCCPGPSWW